MALYDEFEEVEIDSDKHELAVTTDPIVLDDLNSAFPDPARLADMGSSHAYRVVALDPHPACPEG